MTPPIRPAIRRARWDELDPATLHDLIRLRVDVFVVEQDCAYPELDGRDRLPSTEHVWIDDDRGVAAYLRVLAEVGGGVRLGRVCSRADTRGRGLVAALLADALARYGGSRMVLDAQTYLAAFYARHGFVACGPEFVEDGIPHMPMLRPASSPDPSGSPVAR